MRCYKEARDGRRSRAETPERPRRPRPHKRETLPRSRWRWRQAERATRQRVIFGQLRNVLDPGVAVAFEQRQPRAAGAGAGAAAAAAGMTTRRPQQLGRKARQRGCKALREAKVAVRWHQTGLSSDRAWRPLGTLGSVLPALETLHLYRALKHGRP